MNTSRTFSVKKWLLIGLPVALVLLMTCTGYWLLRTHSGAVWVWGQVENTSAGALRGSILSGDFASGVVIQDIAFQSENIDLSVGKVELIAGPGWLPLVLEVRSLIATDVHIINTEVESDVEPVAVESNPGSILSALDLPIPILIQQAVVKNILLGQADEPPQRVANSIEIEAALNQQLVLTRFDIETATVSANLSGHLQLKSPFNLAATLEGDFASDEQLADIKLKVPFKFAMQGQLDDWTFELDTTIHSGQTHSSQLEAFGSGTSQAIELHKVTLNGHGVDLDMHGKLDWSLMPEADIKAEITKLDLSPWLSDWPADRSIEGSFELSWSQHGLRIPVCELSVSGTALSIDLEADIDIETNQVVASMKWVNLDWPLAQADPAFSSPAGQMQIDGSLDKWQANGRLDMRMRGYPQGSFDIQADGDLNHASLAVSEGEILGGSLAGQAEVDWSDELSWVAAINAEQVNPLAVFPGWPGRLNTDLEIEADGRQNTMKVSLQNLDGVLRGVPLNASGVFTIDEGEVGFNDVRVSTDKGSLLLDGKHSDSSGLSLDMRGELPSTLLWGVSGNVEARGRFSTHVDKPVFELELSAAELDWHEYHIKTLTIGTKGAGPIPALKLNANSVSLQDVMLDELRLKLEPEANQHGLILSVLRDNVRLNGEAKLIPENANRPFSGNWSAYISKLLLAINESYVFSMLEPAILEWSPESTELQRLCMVETTGAQVCMSGSYADRRGSALNLDVAAVPLNYLRDMFALDVQFEQSLEGHLQWQKAVGQPPTGGADLRITAGEILHLEDQQLLAETSEGRFAFTLQDGNLESGTFDLEFPGIGFIDFDFDVMEIADNEAGDLQGRALVQLNDIAILGQLTLPGMDEIGGQFKSTIQLGGTLYDPTIDGGFMLSEGLIEYVPLGLLLDDIEVEGQLDELDRGSLSGAFRAGEGIGSINGQIQFDDFENIQLDVELAGEQLLLTNTDQLKLRTNTDIKVAMSPGRLDIDGHIRVPSARFSPSNLLLGGVSDSPDLIIEPVEGQTEAAVENGDSFNRVFGNLELTFGDDVLIQVPGVETTLAGSAIFNWVGESIPSAQGSYQLNGNVDIYGPILQIDNGHINFPDIAADNPILNIRAEREIYGNTQIRSAGVQVVGTLKRPVIEAYTVPITNEDRAWSLLVTGTDFDQSQGVSGFDVGTYIAPKLYISYGVSLFEDENVVSARYDLKKGFGIKVSSGQRETGLDASYTIDR